MRYLVLIGGWFITLMINNFLEINRQSWEWYIGIAIVYLIFQGMGGFRGNTASKGTGSQSD